MTETTWPRVARALLGRWPSQVATWGEEGIAAFIEECQADGLTPDRALYGIRMHRPEAERDFPPSVAAVSKLARMDPDRPTFDGFFAQLYGPGGMFGFKRAGVTISPWVEAFAEQYGRERLRLLPIDHPEEGKWRRRELEQAWSAFLEATEGREVAEIAARSSGGSLGKPDFAATLGRPAAAQIEAGDGER